MPFTNKKGLATGLITIMLASPALATDAEPTPLYSTDIDAQLLNTIADQLPESRQVDAAFLDPVYDPNLYFNTDAQASITFISEGAGYKNSLGYFSFDQGTFDSVSFNSIDTNNSGNITARELENVAGVNDVGIIFGNASGSGGYAGNGGSLETGDTFVLGGGTYSEDSEGNWTMTDGTTFQQDQGLGFFVAANAWKGNRVDSWDNNREIPTYYTMDMLNPENPASATVDDVSTYARHTAMLNLVGEDEVLMGFEDLRRPWGDNDFNDAVFILRTTPETAFTTDNIASALPTPTDPETGQRIETSVSGAPAPGIGAFGGIAIACVAFFGLNRRKVNKKD